MDLPVGLAHRVSKPFRASLPDWLQGSRVVMLLAGPTYQTASNALESSANAPHIITGPACATSPAQRIRDGRM